MARQPTTNFELRRNWVLGGYAAEFFLTIDVPPHIASHALDISAHTLKNYLCTDGEFCELRNIKGRDPHEPLLLLGAPTLNGEELLSVGGTIATGSEPQGFLWEPFYYACHSRFERFEGTRTIVHTPHVTRSQSIPEWLPWWLLGAAAPIEPSYFRLGLEFFTSRFVITRLSFAPVVTETFLIDLVGTTLSLKLKTEQPYWKPCNPFETIGLLRYLSEHFQTIVEGSLSAIFQEQLHAHATF